MRPQPIAIHYMCTWFPLDILLVSTDWIVQIVSAGQNESMNAQGAKLSKVGRTMRGLRILRSLRLLRILKMRHILNELQDTVNNEYIQILLKVVKLVVLVVLINHFVACGWYAISFPTNLDSAGWVVQHDILNRTIDYQYMSSLHWSLTQFTPASMEIFPHTLAERTYAVCTLLFALVIFSSFVSSITTAMTSLRELSSRMNMAKEFSKVNWYLRDAAVSVELTVRIQKFLRHTLKDRKHRLKHGDIELFSWLSEPLSMELKCAVIGPGLVKNRFFFQYERTSRRAMSQICSNCQDLTVSVGDVVFGVGETATRLFYISEGNLTYYAAKEEDPDTRREFPSLTTSCQFSCRTLVNKGDFVSEMPIWVHWAHRGELRASTHTSVVIVHSEKFFFITAQHRAAMVGAQKYAKMYAQRLMEEAKLSDLSLPVTDTAEMADLAFASDRFPVAHSPSLGSGDS